MTRPFASNSRTVLSAIAVAALIPAGSASAALAITNGGFGTDSVNARYIDDAAAGAANDPAWFESTISNDWVEGSWTNSIAPTFPSGSGPALLFDGGGAALGWVYQSLGTIDLSEISSGTLRITADFAEKSDGATNGARFDVLVGNFTGADTSDILGGGLASLGSITLTAGQQGLTADSGDASRQTNVLVGDFDISGLNEGDQVWLRLAESRSTSFTTGDLIIDNVGMIVVPEPSAALLGALGSLLLARRRRRA